MIFFNNHSEKKGFEQYTGHIVNNMFFLQLVLNKFSIIMTKS